MPNGTIAPLRQQDGVTKGQLLDAIEMAVSRLESAQQDRTTADFLRAAARRRPAVINGLDAALAPVGWGMNTPGELYSHDLHLGPDAAQLPADVRDLIDLAIRRFAASDYSGAMTSVCGAVDAVTAEIYGRYSLGNHGADGYQQRVSKSFRALEPRYRQALQIERVEAVDIDRLWSNQRTAVNGAAYVLASFRRQLSDVHGRQEAGPTFVQNALDCAIFVLRSLAPLL